MPAQRPAATRRRAERSSTPARARVTEGAAAAPSAWRHVSLRAALIALALASAGGGWSCQRGDAAADRRPSSATDAIRQLQLGQTTPSDLEQRFGVPDERAADGALTYRFDTTRQRGGQTQAKAEIVTFRFANGKLAKVCRKRP